MNAVSQRQREAVSKGVFGSAHMLAIMVEVSRSPDGRFTAPTIIASTQLPPSTVHAMLNRLKDINFIRRTPERTPDRLAIYERRAHPIWDTVRFMDHEVDVIGDGHLKDYWQPIDQPA